MIKEVINKHMDWHESVA